jgi:hypothetical protein
MKSRIQLSDFDLFRLVIDRGPNVDIDKSLDSRYHFPHFIFSDNNRSSAVEKPLIWDLKKHNHTTFLFRFNCTS